MPALITNVWTGWLSDPLTRRHYARVVIEGCGAVTGYLRAAGARRVVLTLPAATLNLPPCAVRVYDGVVEEVTVKATSSGVVVDITTAVPPKAQLTLLEGTPARAVVDLAATPLVSGFAGRVFVIDAGHGGADRGHLGPIDLEEKNVTLDIALRLEALLNQIGSVPVLTRRKDETMPAEARTALVALGRPEAVISLHMHGSTDRKVKGTAVFAHGRQALPLAEAIQDHLHRKLELAKRGTALAPGLLFSADAHGLPRRGGEEESGPPAVTVEVVTISNPVEEGWLRSCVYRQRAAQAVVNGLAAYLGVAIPRPMAQEEGIRLA